MNGENIFSEIIRTNVTFCGTVLRDAAVFVNDSDVEQVDGYVGLGVLRAFDMLLTQNGIGFAANRLEIRPFHTYVSVASSSTCDAVELPCAITSE